MARKKLPEEHENHERWLVSYADFITLLFAFFVVMYSISSINEGKYRVLSDALISAFQQPQRSVKPIQIGEPSKSPVTSNIEFTNEPTTIEPPLMSVPRGQPIGERRQEAFSGRGGGAGPGDSTIDKIAERVSEAMSELVEQGLVSVNKNDLWVEVEIRDSVLFPSASARLHSDAISVLRKIGDILADFPNPVRVEGFTDDLPINTLIYPSNWELSTARAASVVRLFEHFGIDPQRMSALGYGEHRPRATNETAAGRAKNRRVVVVVLANREVEQMLESHMLSRSHAPEAGDDSAQTQPVAVRGTSSEASAAAPANGAARQGGDSEAAGMPAGSPDAESSAAARDAPEIVPSAPPAKRIFPLIEAPVRFEPAVRVPRLGTEAPVRLTAPVTLPATPPGGSPAPGAGGGQ